MLSWLTQSQWSPYAVGIGIGILSWFTLLISKKPIGCSTTFAKSAGLVERLFGGKKTGEKPYYQKIGLAVDWQFMLVIGIILGSFLSSRLSGDFDWQWIPAQWAAVYGTGKLLRVIAALLGGILLGFGARWADGCTSGHGISGAMQLSVGSWISAIFFFIGGILMAQILF
ncbi:MAG: YeeE/YedE family protein [Anaerolineaceae bacterium]|nr:YeeE/YedE family protein [Anaerolineaceae bacterium]